ncbi:hypothetical protein BD560DRAFT_345958 [Blakeslea trispora]|nr:hypothetical protein BD560DRAFT_345958 [Blakeslea trispora]
MSDPIQQFYNNRKNKVYQHADFDYFEQQTTQDALDEFISYQEIKTEFSQYQSDYHTSLPSWSTSSLEQKQEIIQRCMDQLDLQEQQKRMTAIRQLVYIALGHYGECQGDHRQWLEQNNQLLYQLNIIPIIQQSLYTACQSIEVHLETPGMHLYCQEIDMYLTVLYLVSLYNPVDEKDQTVECLLDLVIRLRDRFTKSFPLKKLIMTLHRWLSLTLSLDSQEAIKSDMRTICQLPPIQKNQVKLTSEELHHWYQQTQQKYHAFQPTPLPQPIQHPLTATYSTELISAMGLSKVTEKMDLPYHTLFPSKTPLVSQPTKRSMETVHLIEKVPDSLMEANRIWLDHLYISLADVQLIHEREKAVHRWEHWTEAMNDWHERWQQLKPEHVEKMNRVEHLFCHVAPHLQAMVVVLLKLLLSTVSIGKDKEAEILEDINLARNRESISKAASGTLLLLLKWFKRSHILKFEYLSQTLVDSGCMLLILKLLGLQEIAMLASKRTDDPNQSFTQFIAKGPHVEEDIKEDYTNKRNLVWSIHLLRILQMITKRKTHRILLLVQYKSSAILKRLLKVGHPIMDLYVLKNLKNQVPFMGRKWRANNMKTISAIYGSCLTYLNDEWLSLQDSNPTEEGTAKEMNLRALTRFYMGQYYLPQLMPLLDDMDGPEATLFHDHAYTLDTPPDHVELDPTFHQDYRDWLESDVYSVSDQRSETEWVGTPLPDSTPAPISPEDLANEINKLYLEELEREFEKKEKQEQPVVDGWDQPIQTPTTNVRQQSDDEDDEEEEVQLDPLEDINWENLTEEDLKARLTLVEKKTVQRWMNVDMEDPRYLKVVNPLETEIPLDEEGWPMW